MGCMDCIMGIIKFLVFGINLLFACAGLALLVVGILYQIDFAVITSAIDNSAIDSFPILAIILGAIIFIIAFFGCCGAVKENRCYLLVFGITLMIIFILQLALGIFAFVQIKDETEFRQTITDDLYNTMQKYKEGDDIAIESMDLLQEELQCCGVNTFGDWELTEIPGSCCGKDSGFCTDDESFTEGCSTKLSNTLYDNIQIIGIVAIVFSITELAAAVFSLILRNSID